MNEYLSRARVLEVLQEIGGCDADPDTWADGWDKAIDEPITVSKANLLSITQTQRC